ncbi:MAG: hypothetical protein ACFFAN_17170 [Promethearchaeota archaeon]
MQRPIRKEKEILGLSKFLDFDKHKKIFFNNLYLKTYHFGIKMLLVEEQKFKEDLRIEKFSLVNYTYLLVYD